ncbi:jg1894 [Pararge aegeria aegeria]|uniref:Jg1894 protein n=1 Tax=Pararge aegeria aegeria TaxID=348720 RepID=A0A8S4QKA7_9NEOP|nr:jg1894 [Pararge aegeria aegeria]
MIALIHVMLQCHGVSEQRTAYLDSSASLSEAVGDLGSLLSFYSGAWLTGVILQEWHTCNEWFRATKYGHKPRDRRRRI